MELLLLTKTNTTFRPADIVGDGFNFKQAIPFALSAPTLFNPSSTNEPLHPPPERFHQRFPHREGGA